MKKNLFIVPHRIDRSPGQRFRFEQYLAFLEEKGFESTISYIISEKDDKIFYAKGKILSKFWILLKSIFIRIKDVRRAKEFDIIFIYREALMLGSTFFEKRLRKKNKKIVFDFDDAIWLNDVSEGNKYLFWLKNPSKTSTIIKLSAMVLAGNNYLAKYAAQYNNNINVIPTTLNTNIFKPITKSEIRDILCIGWTGTSTTLKHFKLLLPVLIKIKKKYGESVYFKVISDVPFIAEELEVVNCKWNLKTEVEDLSEIDIGIMPLPDDEWAKGKCGFKGLQYMSLEIPAIMSPVGVNTEIIQDGVNGFLAKTEGEWIKKIFMLIESPVLRKQLGVNGRKTVVDKFSFDSQKQKYLDCFEELLIKGNN